MIPGPLAHRVAAEPGLRPAPAAGGEPGSDANGQSFEDLLSAMLAPGAAPAVQPDAVAPEAQPVVFEQLDSAEMFNETGLFRGAAPLAAEIATTSEQPNTAGRPVRPEISAGAALQLALSPSPDAVPASPEALPAVQPAAAGQVALSGGPVPIQALTRAAIRASVTLRGQPAAAPQDAVQTPEAARAASSAARRPQAAAMLVQAYLARSGPTPAQVTVQAVEGGISLVARADKLSREERDRLRVEIGELLARHGLAAAEMMLNGEAWLSPEGGKD